MKSSETVDKIEKSTLVTCRKFQYNSKRGMQFSLNQLLNSDINGFN